MSNTNLFADHFSTQAQIYAQARPTYPDSLFAYLASQCVAHNLAWDCGTGSGQSANGLAKYFTNIIATDPSAQQLQNAIPQSNIEYRQAPAENAPFINDDSIDLITVATALHWFDTNAFYTEANRVLKSNGILAVWSYWGNTINEQIDELINKFAYEFLLPYWPNGAKKNWVVQYTDVQLPFSNIENPSFKIEHNWTLNQFKNYMNSWSAVNEYIKQHQSNPLDTIAEALHELWTDENEIKLCTWNLVLLVSKKK